MHRFRHWRPRYVFNRIAVAQYYSRNPDKPWLTPDANSLLATLLTPSDNGIEWGSGRSTHWFASRLNSLVSVEHQSYWFDVVSKQLAQAGATNVDYRLVPIEANGVTADSAYVRTFDE